MPLITVTITDAVGAKRNRVELPDDAQVARIVAKLIEPLKLPLTAPDGQPMSYRVHHIETGKAVADSGTLAGAGVKDGDTLRLVPEIVAG